MTEGEKLLIDDLNEFVRQSADQLEEQQSTGIRPPPKIETTEQTLDTTRFGMEFSPEPLSEAAPGGGGEPPPSPATGACCVGVDCTIETEADCTGMGGVYQGDGTDCDPNPCGTCPCQPTHVSISWSASNVDEPMFDVSYSDEVDISPLDESCTFTYLDERTVSAPCGEGTIDGTIQFHMELSYDFDTEEWVVYFDVFITAGAFFCEFVYDWPEPASLTATMPTSDVRRFACPPETIDEDLLDDAYALFAGHVTADFT